MPKSKRGFALMPRAKQQIIAGLGGKAAHAQGTAHTWTREEAQRAGRKGGHRRNNPTRLTSEKAKPKSKPTLQSDEYTQTDGYKVRQIRTSLKEKQRQFAKRFNVSQATVWFWEANRGKPPREVLEMQPGIPDLNAQQR